MKLFDLIFPELKEFIEIGYVLNINKGLLEAILENLEDEKLFSYFKNNLPVNSMPIFQIKFLSKFFYLLGEKRVSNEFNIIKRLIRLELLSYQKGYEKLKNKFIYYFIKEDFDTLITPVFPCPAFEICLGADYLNLYFSALYSILLTCRVRVFQLLSVKIINTLISIIRYTRKFLKRDYTVRTDTIRNSSCHIT